VVELDPKPYRSQGRSQYDHFSKIPHWVIESGIWAVLTPKAKAVYLTLWRFADFKGHIAFPTVPRLSELSGVSRGKISQATRELELRGLIQKKRAARRFNYRNVYRMVTTPPPRIDIYPQKTDKCRRSSRGKDGRFISSPSSMDNQHPSNADTQRPSNADIDIHPSNTDQKENLEILKKRDTVLETASEKKNPSGSQETFPNGKSPEASCNSHKSINKEELFRYYKELGRECFIATFSKLNYPPSVIEEVLRDSGSG
jgi:hypothetical protein